MYLAKKILKDKKHQANLATPPFYRGIFLFFFRSPNMIAGIINLWKSPFLRGIFLPNLARIITIEPTKKGSYS